MTKVAEPAHVEAKFQLRLRKMQEPRSAAGLKIQLWVSESELYGFFGVDSKAARSQVALES